MKAHELAQILLAGPDIEIFVLQPEYPDYPINITGVGSTGTHYEADDVESETAEGTKVIILASITDDGVLNPE